MKNNKRIFVFLAFFGICFYLFAENPIIKELVDEKYYEKLVKDGSITIYRDDGSSEYLLLPKSEYSEQINKCKIQKDKKNFPFVYEGLYILNKKDLIKSSNSSAENLDITDVSRICRSVSKMQGMKYYSTSKKKEMVLYEKAYMIADENSKEPIPDKNTGNADGQVSYSYQDDNSFGPNRYKLCYFQNENQLLAQFNLVDVMGLGPFKAIYPGKFINNILVIDCGEDFLLYLCTDLDSVKFPGIKGQIVDSMTSRMDAIYKWFITQF